MNLKSLLARPLAMGATSALIVGLGSPALAQGAAAGASSAEVDMKKIRKTAEAYLESRASMVTNSPDNSGSTERSGSFDVMSSSTPRMAEQLRGEFSELTAKGERYKKADGGYTDADVRVTTQRAQVKGDTLTVRLTEDTRLHMPFTAEQVDAGAPAYEEYSLPHTLTFARQADGQWKLASDKAHTGNGLPPSTQPADAPRAERIPGNPKDSGNAKSRTSKATSPPERAEKEAKPLAGYDYDKMVAYANKHWKNYNSDYRSYPNDCTNFISQIMYEGGWDPKGGAIIDRKDNRYWFYGPATFWTSYTWGGAENWYWFATDHSKRTDILPDVRDMLLADVLQADFDKDDVIDHTMLVTKHYDGEIYLTYHTSDTHNKSLSKILADYEGSDWYAHRT